MGFNIAGIVASANLSDNLPLLEDALYHKLEKVDDITFEEALSNWKEEGICDVYFGPKGTIAFLSHEMCSDTYNLEGMDTLTFALSETAMAFTFEYYKHGEFSRSMMEYDGERKSQRGTPLESESEETTCDELIWMLIDKTLGESIHEIDFEAKAVRYRLVERGQESDPSQLARQAEEREAGMRLAKKLIIAFRIYNIGKWGRWVGVVFCLLSLLGIYYNLIGITLIIFFSILYYSSAWYSKRLIKES